MSTDRRSYENEWLNQPGFQQNTPLSDPLQSAGTTPINRDSAGRNRPEGITFCFGFVIEHFSYLNTYRVTIENGSVVQCSALSHQSNMPFGVSTANTYAPGQEVLVALRSNAANGVILGAVAREVTNPGSFRPDTVFSGSNTGFFVEPTSNYWNGLTTNDLVDFSNGRPFDITCGSQSVTQSSIGVGYFITESMTGVKVDEETGLYVFYDDSMTRLTGRNLQIRAHCLEFEWLNDESEINGYEGSSPYFWEQMGAYTFGVTTSRHILDREEEPPEEDPENPDDPPEEETSEVAPAEGDAQALPTQPPEIDGIRYGFVQPLTYDQQPFHRVTLWSGYLGQGGRKAIVSPGPDVEGNEQEIVNKYSDESRWMSMSTKQDTLAGSIVTTASGDILFVKRPPLPTPRRREKPESPLGDRGSAVSDSLPRNYDPCGVVSDEEIAIDPDVSPYSHYVTAEIPLEDLPEEPPPEEPENPDDPPAEEVDEPPVIEEDLSVPEQVLRTALTTDEMAYMVGWEGVHAFHYHKKDFFLPQESDLDEFNVSRRPPYESLSEVQYMGQKDDSPYPNDISVKVDHRYGEVKIYLNTAYFGMKKDGSWTLRTGCGCEMRSENGNMSLIAPGDIILRPGRNLVSIAGNDTILKSGQSTDITAAGRDLRLAANNNLMALSATSGQGVMLFQSNSDCILDPEKENTIDPPEEDPDNPPPPDAPPVETEYNLGEEVIGSGILFKARQAQVTAAGREVNLVAGMKEYEEPTTDENGEPVGEPPADSDKDDDPETGEKDEPNWTWKPGKIRLFAEKGQIENLAGYVIDFLSDTASFGNDSTDDANGKSGAYLQVFMSSKERTVDDANNPPPPQELPPNILAAAGTADLSGTNTCLSHDRNVCYEVKAVHEFREKKSSICGTLYIGHELFVGGCAYIRGNLSVFDRTQLNQEPEIFDGRLMQQRADVRAFFDEADTRCWQLLPSFMAEQAGLTLNSPAGEWLDFSFRTMAQYGTDDGFCMMESWWQHQVRVEAEGRALDGDPEAGSEYGIFFPELPTGLTYWNELTTVTWYARQAETAPYPGVKYVYYDTEYNEDETLKTFEKKAKPGYGVVELNLYDETEGRPKDRDDVSTYDESYDIYEDARLQRGTKISLGHYISTRVARPDDPVEEVPPEEPPPA